MTAGGIAVGTRVDIGPRPIPQEPMVRISGGLLYNVLSINAPWIWWFRDSHYMILNLGISPNFCFIDFEHLTFPTMMCVDYVRVYQNPDIITSVTMQSTYFNLFSHQPNLRGSPAVNDTSTYISWGHNL